MKPCDQRYKLMLIEARKLSHHIYQAYMGPRDAVVIHCPEISDEIIEYLKPHFNISRRDTGGYIYFKRTGAR